MNATNRPVDFLLNIESPSINLAQRRGSGPSSNQNSELSALNRKENSFGDVYRQQRRDDNEVRQQAQQKRSAEQPAHHEKRPVPVQQNASLKQSRAETTSTSDGKALPPSSPTDQGQDEVSVDARNPVETVVEEQATATFGLLQDVEVTVNFEESELSADDSETADLAAGSFHQSGDSDTGQETLAVDSNQLGLAGAGIDASAEQQADSEQQANAQHRQTTEEAVVLRAQQFETDKQRAVVADVSRELRQSRLGNAIEGAAKGEINTATPAKATGVGGEQNAQQVPQDRLAQLTAATDFKVLREQLAAGTVKVDGSGAKGASLDALSAAESAGDRQPRLNALTQASQALAAAKPGVVSASVQQPVGSPEWGQAMSQRIMWLVNRGISAAELQLNPRDLGPVDVRINVTGEQTTVQFSSQNAAVREALESSVVRLREMMESSGLDLADVDVSDQSQSEQAQADAGNASERATAGEKDGLDDVAESVITERIESDGLVDFYA